jgi:hypothetical protein
VSEFERETWEQRVAREAAKFGKQSLDAVLTALGDPPDFSRVPSGFWDEQSGALATALTPLLQEVYLAAAEAELEDSPVGVDWTQVNRGAVTWSNQYGYELVRGLTETTRELVREAVSNFFTQDQTLDDLRARLESAFGPIRADMIATTEVTRAATEGERALVEMLEEQGLLFLDVWETAADEFVCPICMPLDGQEQGPTGYVHPDNGNVYDGPPAHPRCRCRERHESVL